MIIAMLPDIWRTDYDSIMISPKTTFPKNSLENIMVCCVAYVHAVPIVIKISLIAETPENISYIFQRLLMNTNIK
jgi:hypothetical protein